MIESGLHDYLFDAITAGASDLHITVGLPPMIRVHGKVQPLAYPTLTPSATREMIYDILSNEQRQRLENAWELDTAYTLPRTARFRVNVYFQRGALGAAFRTIPEKIPSFEEQWGSLAPLLPPRRPRGRPRAEDRKTLNGILYVLRTGCRWEDVPREYGSPTTCWRRLKAWEEDGTWEKVWRGLLALLDERENLDWDRAFLDGSFIPAKKGGARLGRPSGARAPS